MPHYTSGHTFSLDFTCLLWHFRMLTIRSFSYSLNHILLLFQKILQSIFLKGGEGK